MVVGRLEITCQQLYNITKEVNRMERITYRKTLDVHKNGVQFLLQGFQTADNMSRVIEISLMASGDAIDFPLERVIAVMYVTPPGATEPSINECTIVDNKIVYNVLPITTEGITKMQLKLIETSIEGAKSVLASPEFAVEVSASEMGDEDENPVTTYTALENCIAKAESAYNSRLMRIELTQDCIFRAYYAGETEDHETIYETDILQKLFLNGNVLLSESYAHGGTGVRTGEDTDNSKYYSNVSKSEALNAKNIMENSQDILDEVRLHGTYTTFSVNFDTGEVEYVSPSFDFKVNSETGELEAKARAYEFEPTVYQIVEDWLAKNNVVLKDLQSISETHGTQLQTLEEDTKMLKESVRPIELGGTGANTADEAIRTLGIDKYQVPWNVDKNIVCINQNPLSLSYKHHIRQPYNENVYPPSIPVEKEILMKNSGTIYLRSKSNISTNRYDNNGKPISVRYAYFGIYLNNELKKSYGNDIDTPSEDAKNNPAIPASEFDTVYKAELHNSTLKLRVKKGDILKVRMSTQSVVGGGSIADPDYLEISATLDILANAETPYRYWDFDNAMPIEITNAEEI